MEKLAALCCLWVFGFGAKAEYSAELDRLFLEDPKNDFLLELEDLGNDGAAAWEKISPLVESSLNAAYICYIIFLVKFPITSRFTLFSLRTFRMTNFMMKSERAKYIKRRLTIIRRSHENFYRLQQ